MAKKSAFAEQAEKLTLELRRGSLVLATLSQLDSPKYGYALIQDLAVRGLVVEQGTLYPLLRRLEEQGLLESSWNVDGSRPRKYYRLNEDGAEVLSVLSRQWRSLVEVLDGLIDDSEESDPEGVRDGTD